MPSPTPCSATSRPAVDHELVPTAVFSTPEIGTVGLPEHIARERYPKLDIYRARFRPLKHTLSGRDERMFMKLLVDGESDKVVGCHILGADAAEIVQMAAHRPPARAPPRPTSTPPWPCTRAPPRSW